jgi:soluble cytochrome b562
MELLKTLMQGTLYKEGRAASLGGKTLMIVADRNSEDHRNGFIRLGLYSGMKLFLAFFVLMTAQAMSLKDFNVKPSHDQSVYVVDFIEKMTADLGAKNPQLAQDIRDWFSRKQDGKPYSAGLEKLYVQLGALESLAHDGKVDLAKIQVEGVIVKVVKDKFPPPSQK